MTSKERFCASSMMTTISLPRMDAFEQDVVHFVEQVIFRPCFGLFAQLFHDAAQELRLRNTRVEQQRGVDFLATFELFQQLPAERGFAAAHFAGQHDEALLVFDPVAQVLHGLLVGGTEEEETRVGRHMERHFFESKVFEIHSLE